MGFSNRARIALIAAAVVLLGGGGLGWWASHRDSAPQRFSDRFHAATFTRPSGSSIAGVEAGSGIRAVVISHGATGTKEDFVPIAEAFADAGWRVVAYDAGANRMADLTAVVDTVRTSGSAKIVLLGGSLGACLSIAAADSLKAVGVVGLSPPSDQFGVVAAAAAMTTPMFLAAAQDNHPYDATTREIAAAAGIDPVIVSGARHGSGVVVDHPELLAQIVAFCAKAAA
jgi:alpha-beta hydrolase superfamily lysophospholipase